MMNQDTGGAPRHILVIKHGALGDFISATGAFAAIRGHHKDCRVVLLTTAPYEGIARQTGFFDDVWTDGRARGIKAHIQMARSIARGRFDRIYDLQNSDRTHLYYWIGRLFSPLPWSGSAFACPYRQHPKDRHHVHAYDRFAHQLSLAGIETGGALSPVITWAMPDISAFNIQPRSVLIFPGSSARGARKRWGAEAFATLTIQLEQMGYIPLLLGGNDDGDTCDAIQSHRRHLGRNPIGNLCGQTQLADIPALAAAAAAVIGNDTGPIHMASAVGAPTLIIWSSASDPHVYAPRGNAVTICHAHDLKTLDSTTVLGHFKTLMDHVQKR